MNEDRFDQNFTWYEWSFVSPTEVPKDDLHVPSEAENFGYGFHSAMVLDVDRCQDGFRPWTT
jgi:hypothetical protein